MWGSEVEIERKNRIKVAVAAYAYEIKNDPFMSDDEFDRLCESIRPEMKTGNRKLDNFFRNKFEKQTGMWVHMHPEKRKLDFYWEKYYK